MSIYHLLKKHSIFTSSLNKIMQIISATIIDVDFLPLKPSPLLFHILTI